MKIALYGATGNIGRRILNEALERGHQVTAVVRDPSRLTRTHENLTVVRGDATDIAGITATVAGHDVVIGSISGRRDADASLITLTARTLLSGTEIAGVRRLFWVGGAATLEVAPGTRLLDTPGFPEAYRPEAEAAAAALDDFRDYTGPVDWTFLSPAAIIAPGERTGVFRVGKDQLLIDAEGNSRISIEDFAIAVLDEIEHPQHLRQRFTVSY